MQRVGRPGRRVRIAVTAVSGGMLAIIWSGVWYVASRRGTISPTNGLAGYQVLFGIGLAAALVGFAHLRYRKLSVIDGSSLYTALPKPSAAKRDFVERPTPAGEVVMARTGR